MLNQDTGDQILRDVVDILAKTPEGRAKLRESATLALQDPPDYCPVPKHVRDMYDYVLEKLRVHGTSLQGLLEPRAKLVASGQWEDKEQEPVHPVER
jgi:hypothetical protein